MTKTKTPATYELAEGTSLFKDAMRRFRRNKMSMVCLVLSLLMLVACFFPLLLGDEIANAYTLQEQTKTNQPPALEGGIHYWCGTDAVGRSVFFRVLYGGRISFAVAFVGTAVSLVIGIAFGAIAGYFGGTIDNLMMRFVDMLYGLPYMFLVILIMTLLPEGANNVVWIFVALGLVQWLTMARITRGQVISLREQEFITAARTIGASTPRIIAFHIVPNLLGPIIVYTTLTVPGVMLQESFLSFLGLGIREPDCSWGSLASEGIQALSPIANFWWQTFFPCLALALTLFSLNFVGDGLRDALDPKGRK